MKTAIVTFVVLFISIMSPLSMNMFPADETPYILTLDVCNASGAAMSVNADASVIHEDRYQIFLPEFSCFHNMASPVLIAFLIPFQDERPPEV
jgi:hypothetical protein